MSRCRYLFRGAVVAYTHKRPYPLTYIELVDDNDLPRFHALGVTADQIADTEILMTLLKGEVVFDGTH
ncbi:hypothetical protein [Aliivibrio kagoshimensis]|uniref:hypothetical protein n=1 Tax=Aliivibrio kagoshimensis TaxID=2910230 RepID=UPI003D0A29BF